MVFCDFDAVYKCRDLLTYLPILGQKCTLAASRAAPGETRRKCAARSIKVRKQTDPRDAVLQAHVLYTDVDGQCDKLVTETVTSLPH